MKQYPKPAQFDGGKFAERYNLDPLVDFWADEEFIYVPDDLPDDPPIFEAPDTPEVVIRELSKEMLDAVLPQSNVLRGVVAVLLDELNAHADKINSILTAVDQSASLVDLKTRIAAIADYPQRTLAQARTAIKNKITAGEVDA